MKGTIDLLVTAANENNQAVKDIALKNNGPFRSRISKFNRTLIENAEDLDIVMPINNLLEYSQNYSMKSGSLSNYRDDTDDINYNASDGESFNYKIKTVGNRTERLGNEGDANL